MKKSYLKYLLHAAVLIGLIIAGAKYLNGEEVAKAVRSFNYLYAPFLLLLATGYVLAKAWRFVLLLRPLDDTLPWGVIVRAYLAGQAATLLPGGIAARAGLLKQVDVPIRKGSIPVVFSSGLDQVVLISSAMLAALWFEPVRTPVLVILGILIGVGAAVLWPISRRWLFQAADWIANKFDMVKPWHNFLEAVPELLTWGTMVSCLAITVFSFAFHLVALDLSAKSIGLTLPYATLALAYVVPTVVGRLSGLPAGVGVTEAGMAGFLASTSQVSTDTGLVVALIFRVATVFFAALLGALVYFLGWRGRKEISVSPSTSQVR